MKLAGYKVALWAALLPLALALAACEQGGEDDGDGKLKFPVPEPSDPIPQPIPPTPPETEPEEPPKPREDPETAPVFKGALPGTLFLRESERWELHFPAEDPDGGPISYFYQCPYACPSGVTINPLGLITWTPGYDQAGLYDVVFVATDTDGESALSGSVRIIVENKNRSPSVEGVTVVPDRADSPTNLTCVVQKRDPDGDVMTTRRTWFVDGTASQTLTGQTISSSQVLTGQQITCRADVVDEHGAEANAVTSEVYTLPNKEPVLHSVAIVAALGGAVFKVGDQIRCDHVASDADGHALYREETVILETSTGREVAREGSPLDLVYTLTKAEAHKDLACRVKISDSFASVERVSSPVRVANSAPVITAAAIAVMGDGLPKSGATARCEMVYSDPDGDPVIPDLVFRNGDATRGTGTFDTQSETILARRYKLRSVYDVANPLDADIRGMRVFCVATARDLREAQATSVSDAIIIIDSEPTLTVTAGSGSLTQSLVTGQKIVDVRLTARDFDGDEMLFEKTFDSCVDRGLPFTISIDGRVTSGLVPEATTYPQSARDCKVAYRVNTALASTVSTQISVTIPNRAPILSCTNRAQILKTAPENHFRQRLVQAVPDEQKLTPSVCTVTDPDGGDDFRFSLDRGTCPSKAAQIMSDIVPDAQSITASGLVVQNGKAIWNVDGNMGLDACAFSVTATDGEHVTAPEHYSLTPKIDLSFDAAFDVDTSCMLTANGLPDFNGIYEYDSVAAPASVSLEGATAATQFATRTTVGGRWAEATLEGYLVSASSKDLLLDWTMRGYFAGPPAEITSRTVKRMYRLTKETLTDPGFYALRPLPIMNFDASEGRQISPTPGCLANSSCPAQSASNRRASIAAGKEHTCMVGVGGLVQCWGNNDKRQTGVITPFDAADSQVLKTVAGITATDASSRAVMVAAGDKHNCALMEDGKVRCWGDNFYGQLGDGTSSPSNHSAVLVQDRDTGTTLSDAIAVAAGGRHSCALLSTGVVKCWGAQGDGQLGVRDAAPYDYCSGVAPSAPTCSTKAVLVPGLSGVVGIAAGGSSAGGHSTCAVLDSGQAACWGQNGRLQQGVGPTGVTRLSPFTEEMGNGEGDEDGLCDTGEICKLSPVLDRNQIFSLSMSPQTTCAISKGGVLSCFGEGSDGQLGNNTTTDAPKAAIDAILSSPAAAAAVGLTFSCAVIESRRVECFGRNNLGQLGINDVNAGPFATGEERTVQADYGGATGIDDLADVVAIAAGDNHACAIDESRRVWCWGNNNFNQLGVRSGGTGGMLSAIRAIKVSSGAPIAAARGGCTQVFRFTEVTQ